MPPDQPDTYRTLANSALAEPDKSRGSRFIGEGFPVATADEAMAALETVRKREHAATHHCWAYRLGSAGEEYRYSDDGEPYGSAGIPILKEIERRDLANVLVVVTRYYGGTKLGTGGLARAYGGAAGLVLDRALKREVVVRVRVRLLFAFSDTSPAMRTIELFDTEMCETTYTAEGAVLDLKVRRSQVELLQSAFAEAMGGRGEAVVLPSNLTCEDYL